MTKLDRENMFVFTLVQALLGAVSPNFRRVSIDVREDGVRREFTPLRESEEDREEISDVAAKFQALLGTLTPVETHVLVSDEDFSETLSSVRVAFSRRES